MNDSHVPSIRYLRVLLAAIPVLFAASSLLADGFMYIPNPPPFPSPRPLPFRPPPRPNFSLEVTRHRVAVEIDETAARTRVEETFYNPNDAQLEGVYLFPLPADAAVSSFAMKMGGREVTGEILEKGRARQIYEQIVRQARDPGLLEYVDRGLFRASVFPIPARGNVEVTIEYSEALGRERGTATYSYPLDTGKYSAGDYKDVVIDLKIRSSQPVRSINSPSHDTALVARPTDREARVTFEAKTLKADKDFIVTWNVSEDALAPTLLTDRGAEPEGFFFLSIAPRPDKPKAVVPKDLAFVIDTSGSMLGTKLEQVKKALKYCLANMNQGDRFTIIDFSTEARRFRDGMTEVTEDNRKAAAIYVDELKARGGTNIEEGLRFAFSDLQSKDRLGLIVLLTDGEPTIGVVAPAEIVRSVKEKNAEKRRVFVFGVGEDLNAKLLDAIAKETRAVTQYIRSGDSIEVPLANFYDKIDSPVFTDLELSFPAGGVSDVFPRPLPDLFRGEQLDIFGRYAADGQRTVVLHGKYQGEERVFEYSLPFAGASNPFIPRLWATRKIGYLLEQIRLAGETAEVKDEVVRLSKRYGVITPYTSYLILEENELARRGEWGADGRNMELYGFAAQRALAPRAAAGVPRAPGVDAAEESAAEAEDLALAKEVRKAGESLGQAGGAGGVEASRDVARLRSVQGGSVVDRFLSEKVNVRGERVKQIERRTFYFQGERWVDSSIEPGKLKSESDVRHVKYLSDEYFKLLTDEPGIGKLLSVGTQVTFLWKEKVISIDA
jgi:Ca-activated chloride channel family protein